jgi:FkbM family methyltransferase
MRRLYCRAAPVKQASSPTPVIAAIRDHTGDELRFLLQGATVRDRLWIARMLVHLHLRVGRARSLTRSLPRRDREFNLHLKGGPSLRLRLDDDVVVVSIFGLGEYNVDLSRLGEVSSLLDLGANVGLASIYLSRWLEARQIVCVEPSPASFRLLQENLRRNLPSATAVNAAIVAEPGAYRVAEGEFPGETRVEMGGGTVEGLTVIQLLDRTGIEKVDLMKIDIEGGEIPLFERAEEWGDRVGAILGEVHPPLTVEQAQANLSRFGFAPVPMLDRPLFRDILYVHKPAANKTTASR